MKKFILIPASIILFVSLAVTAWFAFAGPKSNATVVSAPEQTEASTPERFKVSTVEVKRPTGKNLALKQKVKSNGITDVYTPERAVDGETKDSSYWEGTSQMPNTFTVTLDQPSDVGVVLLALNPNPIWQKRKQTFSIQVSKDGDKVVATEKDGALIFDKK